MSGASALASARRRRAGTQNDPAITSSPQSTKNKSKPDVQETSSMNSDQKYTPLQILQAHDIKISNLENTLHEKITTLLNSALNEKFVAHNEMLEDKFNKFMKVEETVKNLEENKFVKMEESIKVLVDEINKLLNANAKASLDEQTMINNMNTKMEQSLSGKLSNVNDTIKSILMNIEKLSVINNINEINTKKIDELVNELNGLKMLVIKNQTLSLETNNEMMKIKTNMQDLDEIVDSVKNSVESTNSNDSFNMNDNTAQMLFKSMLESSFSNSSTGEMFNKLNILDNDESDDLSDDIDKNVNEIQLTETDLQHLKDEVIEEIKDIHNLSTIDGDESDEKIILTDN